MPIRPQDKKKNRSPYEFIYTIIKVHKYSGNTNEVFWDIGYQYTGLERHSNYIFSSDGGN